MLLRLSCVLANETSKADTEMLTFVAVYCCNKTELLRCRSFWVKGSEELLQWLCWSVDTGVVVTPNILRIQLLAPLDCEIHSALRKHI